MIGTTRPLLTSTYEDSMRFDTYFTRFTGPPTVTIHDTYSREVLEGIVKWKFVKEERTESSFTVKTIKIFKKEGNLLMGLS